MTMHKARVLPPTDGRSTHVLAVECGECGLPMKLGSTKVEGQTRWAEFAFSCPACRPWQTVVVRWDAAPVEGAEGAGSDGAH